MMNQVLSVKHGAVFSAEANSQKRKPIELRAASDHDDITHPTMATCSTDKEN
jgi:hypothetical protein